MKASEIMTTNVITISEDSSVKALVTSLLDNHISGLPVVDSEGKLVGIVTEGDLLRRSELHSEIKHRHWLRFFISTSSLVKEYVHANAQYVNEIMTTTLISAGPEDPVEDIILLMDLHDIKRVLITDAGILKGIISRSDVMKTLRILLHKRVSHFENDDILRKNILQEIKNQPWAPENIDIIIKAGEVHAVGRILNEDIRSAIHVLLEGFVEKERIKDHIVYIEPITGLYVSSPDETQQ